MTFKDKDKNGIWKTFLAQEYSCHSSYISDPNGDDGVHFSEKCEVNEEFSSNNYKSSPDGAFDFKILNMGDDSVLLTNVDKLKVILKGSFIPFVDSYRRDRRHLPEGWAITSSPLFKALKSIGLYTMVAAFVILFVMIVVIMLGRKKGSKYEHPGIELEEKTDEEAPLQDMN